MGTTRQYRLSTNSAIVSGIVSAAVGVIKQTLKTFAGAVALYVAALSSPSALAAPASFSEMILLGDSLSDTGNTEFRFGGPNPALGSAIGYGTNGRFSNGLVWHEYLAPELGLAPALNSEGGNGRKNYAFGGAQVNSLGGPTAGLFSQLDLFAADLGGAAADENALYVTWIGANDVRAAAATPTDFTPALTASLNGLFDTINNLAALGAKTFLIPNLPDIGQIPEFVGGPAATNASNATAFWNQGLKNRIASLASATDLDLIYVDIFSAFNNIVADPAGSGFTDASTPCRSVDLVSFAEIACADVDTRVFWDQIHPTTAGHAQTAGFALAAIEDFFAARVPTPPTIALLFMGLCCMRRLSAAQRA